jgi:hypothetical protein
MAVDPGPFVKFWWRGVDIVTNLVSGLLLALVALGSWRIQQSWLRRREAIDRRRRIRISLETLLNDSDLAVNDTFLNRLTELVENIRKDALREKEVFRKFLEWWVKGGRRSLFGDERFPAMDSDLQKHLQQMFNFIR